MEGTMQQAHAARSLACLLFITSSVTLTASRAASSIQCAGCDAQVAPANGEDITTCPGTEYDVKVTVTETDGQCITRYPPLTSDPCLAAGCAFAVKMSWKLPAGRPVDLCNTYQSIPHCVQQTANGQTQQLEYSLAQNCNDIVHSLTNASTSPCGTIQAQVYTKCTTCDN